MLRLDLFKSRNFAVGNVETLALYGGLRRCSSSSSSTCSRSPATRR